MKPAPQEPTPGHAPGRPWLRELAIALVLVLSVAALYAPTATHDFVSYDDGAYITENPRVRGGLSATDVRWAFLEFHSANWHPLTWLSHQLDVELFGLAPGPPHLVNAALHALNAVLCFLFLRRATRALWPSALVALFFAVHPQRVQSVAWAAERKDVLAGAFFFLCCLAYTRHAQAPSRARYAVLLLCFALGLLAKPMLVTLPLVLLVLDFWPLARAAPGTPDRLRRSPRSLLLEKLPLFALAGLSALVTLRAQSVGGAVQSMEVLSLPTRLATALQGACLYLAQAVWPTGLAFFYPHPALVAPAEFTPFGVRTLAAAAFLLLASLGAWRLRRHLPMLWSGWLWYGVMLLPVVGLVQVGTQFYADRYAYLPLVGPTFALVHGLHAFLPRLGARRLAFGLGLALTVPLAWITRRQVATWQDTGTLCERALAVTEKNYVAHEHLGLFLQRQGRLEAARAQYQAALAIAPQLPSSHGNLGAIHAQLGERSQALAEFQEALRITPDFLKARLSLGYLAESEGDFEGASEHYRIAVREHPESPEAWKQLGDARLALDAFDEARDAYRHALEQSGELLEARAGLARALEGLGDARGALAQLETLERLAPAHEAVRHGRAWILATSRDPALRDPSRAQALLESCAAQREPRGWSHLRVQAATLAALAHPAEAARLVAEAAAIAPRAEWKRLEAERARYAAGQAQER